MSPIVQTLKCHDKLFKRCISCSFSQAVYRHVCRGSACVYSRNSVSDGQTEITMAMHADWHFYCCFHHIFDKLANILWSGIAYGIRNIQSVSTCSRNRLENLSYKLPV